MADAVVAHQDDQGLVEDPFGFQALENRADLQVAEPDAIEILRPVI